MSNIDRVADGAALGCQHSTIRTNTLDLAVKCHAARFYLGPPGLNWRSQPAFRRTMLKRLARSIETKDATGLWHAGQIIYWYWKFVEQESASLPSSAVAILYPWRGRGKAKVA